MSELKSVCRCRACYVSHTLYASLQPDAALQLRPPSTVQPWTLFRNLFHTLYQRGGPDTVFYIHVRVSRGEFDQCVAYGSSGSALPDLPFTADDKSAVIQASDVLYLSNLQSFLPDTEWTPVVGKLWSDQRYQNAGTKACTITLTYADLLPSAKAEEDERSPRLPTPPPRRRPRGSGRWVSAQPGRRCGRAPPTPPPHRRPRGSGRWAAAQPGRRCGRHRRPADARAARDGGAQVPSVCLASILR